MKRIIAAVSVLLLIAASGCNDNKDSNEEASVQSSAVQEISQTSLEKEQESTDKEETSSEASEADGSGKSIISKYTNFDSLSPKSQKAMSDFLSSEEFTVEAEGSLAAAKGFSVKFSALIAKNIEASYSKISFMGIDYTTLRTKEGIYSINDDSKTAVFTPSNNTDENTQDNTIIDKAKQALPTFQSFDIENLSFIKDGNEEYSGSTYFCEEYSAGEYTLKLYYDGDELRYITSEKDGLVSVLTILSNSKTADKNLLQIPSDYTIK